MFNVLKNVRDKCGHKNLYIPPPVVFSCTILDSIPDVPVFPIFSHIGLQRNYLAICYDLLAGTKSFSIFHFLGIPSRDCISLLQHLLYLCFDFDPVFFYNCQRVLSYPVYYTIYRLLGHRFWFHLPYYSWWGYKSESDLGR